MTTEKGKSGTSFAPHTARMINAVNGLTVVILAAGEGKRMRSRQPKVLHPLCGRPLIAYPLRAAHALADRFVIVAPPETPALRQAVARSIDGWLGKTSPLEGGTDQFNPSPEECWTQVLGPVGLELVEIAAQNNNLLVCTDVDAIWRVAEALAQVDDKEKAFDAYRYVLANCAKPEERLATVKKAPF